MKNLLKHLLLPLTLSVCLNASGQSTAFTYQGRLTDGPSEANGWFDFEFAVFSADSGGTAEAGPLTTNAVAVSNGLFAVTLDFGAGVFTGPARWLEIGVRTNGAGGFTTLSPRTEITPTPYAIHALNVGSTGIAGTYGEAVDFSNPANSFVGTFAGDGAGVTNVDAATLGGLSAANFWQLGGNAGTTAGVNFVGTTDSQPLILKANGQQALRLESAPETPNVIGGAEANSVSNPVRGATIAGGGLPIYPNRITADYGAIGGGTFHIVGGAWATIAGGRDNRAYGESSTVAGGYANSIDTNAFVGTIGGGYLNRLDSSASASIIAGGWGNRVGTNAWYTTIGGGVFNTNHADSSYATVGGGYRNQVGTGVVAGTVGGGENNRASANHATVAGGLNNTNTGPGATIGGGNANTVLANDTVIAGGIFNSIGSNAFSSVISGGRQNAIFPGSEFATVSGGHDNLAASTEATVGGGAFNKARALSSTVGGGGNNDVSAPWAAIGGGRDNVIATNSGNTFIGGGAGNRVDESSSSAAIGGGQANIIGSSSPWATIGGGLNNEVRSDSLDAVIGGGAQNVIETNSGTTTISGGWFNRIGSSAFHGVIGGGYTNELRTFAYASTISGGRAKLRGRQRLVCIVGRWQEQLHPSVPRRHHRGRSFKHTLDHGLVFDDRRWAIKLRQRPMERHSWRPPEHGARQLQSGCRSPCSGHLKRLVRLGRFHRRGFCLHRKQPIPGPCRRWGRHQQQQSHRGTPHWRHAWRGRHPFPRWHPANERCLATASSAARSPSLFQ